MDEAAVRDLLSAKIANAMADLVIASISIAYYRYPELRAPTTVEIITEVENFMRLIQDHIRDGSYQDVRDSFAEMLTQTHGG